ncbi:MAG: ATP-binding protein [Campylobacterota bacterium]|nr:ATP-binding protein [Campylobacterota bacterium]
MNNKHIKYLVFLLSFIFILMVLYIFVLNQTNKKLFDIQVKTGQHIILSKDNSLKLSNTYHSININYDELTIVNKKLTDDIEKLIINFPKQKKFNQLKNLVYKQNDNVDLIKRSNAIVTNSLYYIRYLPLKLFIKDTFINKKNSKILRKLSRKIIDLSFDIKLANKSVFLEYKNTINDLEKLLLKNKDLINLRDILVTHSKMILKHSKLIHKNIKEFKVCANFINGIYEDINKDISKKHNDIKIEIRYFQITLTLLLIIFIIIIIRFFKKEQELKKEEKRLQSLISKNIIISSTDRKGIITNASDAYCKISGYTREELIGQPHNIIRHPDMPKSAFKGMWETIKSGKVWKGNIKNLKKDGSFYWVYAVIEPVFDSNGKINSYYAIRTDITNAIALEEFTKAQDIIIEEKTKQANKQRDKAIKALKSKDDFLANMSHEIRTPLNGILGFVNILKENIKNTQNKEYLEIVDSSSNHLLGIINDILDFSKIESGKLEIDKIDFDTDKEFRNTINLYKAKAQEKNIDIIIKKDENLPKYLKGDILRIKQVISNILSNAIKFTSKNKKIIVSISYDNKLLNISIKDQGIGIAKKNIKHIFDAFSQEDSSTTRKYGGTGLGLSISSELTKLMGGELKVKSKLGVGSEFYFSIPLDIGSYQKDIELPQNNTVLNSHILIVEDNKANQMFMKVLLKKISITFDIANDGIEAIEKYKLNKYNIILMDENMPNMNGIEATKEILSIEKENNIKHTPIIALTANALKGDREKFLEAGMDEYLTKPIDKNRLIEVLNKVLYGKE